MYGFVVAALIGIIYDGRIEWWEALILVLLYVVYIAVMYYNRILEKSATSTKEKLNCKKSGGLEEAYKNPPNPDLNQEKPSTENGTTAPNVGSELNLRSDAPIDSRSVASVYSSSSVDEPFHPFQPPKEGLWSKIWWYLMWPNNVLLAITTPDVRRPSCAKFFILTFIMSVLWIGSLTYVAVWMITIIGFTFGAPDSVMGITILAAGSSIPEAVSSVIVSRLGKGSMAISNSIGSNSFDILICLGLPWLIKAAAFSSDGAVSVNSGGVGYSAMMLFGSVLLLYVAIVFNKFKLDKKLGFLFLISYIVFLVLASLIELNVFFVVNPPQCRDCEG
ncbi:sodium/potassium/calcium exchanger 3-like [Artemia franciscana]